MSGVSVSSDGRKGLRGRGGSSRSSRSSRSRSNSGRGPHNERDTSMARAWHQHSVYARFWQHYTALMLTTHRSVLQHAAHADASAHPPRRARRSSHQRRLQRHRKQDSSPYSCNPAELWPDSRGLASVKHCGQHCYKHDHHHHHSSDHQHHPSDCQHHLCDHRHHPSDYRQRQSDGRKRSRGHRHHPGDHQHQEYASDLTSQLSSSMNLRDEEEEKSEQSMNPEFVAFMEQSLRHREEWKNKKAVMNARVQDRFNLIEANGINIPLELQEHPDSVRSLELSRLYGAAAPRIHAMETSVQLSYERIDTRRHPKPWPNIPLNVLFGE